MAGGRWRVADDQVACGLHWPIRLFVSGRPDLLPSLGPPSLPGPVVHSAVNQCCKTENKQGQGGKAYTTKAILPDDKEPEEKLYCLYCEEEYVEPITDEWI